MVDYTQELIDSLIECPKHVVGRPTRWKEEDGHRRRDLELESASGEHRFSVFCRQNALYLENYTIGLRYLPAQGGFRPVLLRCNGPHGAHVTASQTMHHRLAHVHRATEDNITSGLRGERSAKPSAYVDLQEAMRHFFDLVNVPWDDIEAYFPELGQLPLWTEEPHDPA